MPSESLTSDFTGSSGTLLSAKAGWTVYRTGSGVIDVPVCDGAGRLTGVAARPGNDNEGTWVILRSPVGGYEGSRIRYTIVAPTTDTFGRIRMFVGATDQSNGIMFDLNPRSANVELGVFLSRQGGAFASLPQTIGAAAGYRTDGKIAVEFQFSADGDTLKVTVFGATTKQQTIDVSSLTLGSKFGLAGKGPFDPALSEGVTVEAVSFINPATTFSFTTVPTFTATAIATYVSAWAGVKPDPLQYTFYDETGTQVGGWTTAAGVFTGTTSGTVTFAATATTGGALTLRVRPLNDPAAVQEAPSVTYYLANVEPFSFGGNVRGSNYFQGNFWSNNYGPASTPQGDRIYLPWNGIEGFSNVQLTGGSAVTGTSSDVTVVSNNGAGALRLNIAANSGDKTRYISFAGALPTTMTAVRDGMADDVPPEFVSGTANLSVIRDLDAAAVNFVAVNPADDFVRNTPATPFWKNDVGTGPDVPFQVTAKAHAKKIAMQPAYIGPWFVIGADIPLEPNGNGQSIRERAIFWRDNIGQRAKIKIEVFNEFPWNTDFTGNQRGMVDGVRKGYYGAATLGALQPTLNVRGEGGGDGGTRAPGANGPDDPGSLRTTGAVASGDHIYANVYGRGNLIYRAKQAAPAGTFVTSGTPSAPTENAYFVALNIDLAQAGRRYQMARIKAIYQIMLDVFGPTRCASQIQMVLMGQAGGSIYDQFADHRAFDPDTFNNIIKVTGAAFYFGPSNDLDPATVTAASLEAAFRAHFNEYANNTKSIVLDSLRMGMLIALYEGMTHPDFRYYNKSGAANLNYYTQWNLLFSSDAGRILMSDIAFLIKLIVPGVAVGYDFIGAEPWSLLQSWTDTANKRFVGWNEGLALAGDIDPPVDPPPVDPPPVTLPTIDRGGAILHQYRDVLGCAPVVCLIAVGIGVARAIV